MNWLLARAEAPDLDVVVRLLNDAAARLHAQGIEQWGPGWMTKERMSSAVERGEVFLVWGSAGDPIATVQITTSADPDFWSKAEQQELALYVGKLARGVNAPVGVGTALLRWVVHHAAGLGYELVRLDAWATNSGLHDFYAARGWRHIRTCSVQGRQSGALFEIEAGRDEEASALFKEVPCEGRYGQSTSKFP